MAVERVNMKRWSLAEQIDAFISLPKVKREVSELLALLNFYAELFRSICIDIVIESYSRCVT